MRIVCHVRSLDHTSQMFRQLDILKILDLFHFNTYILMYKVLNKVVSYTFRGMS